MNVTNHVKSCPIELVVKLINKKWVIQIMRDLFYGKSRFNEFKEDKPDLSNKVLSNCLKDMESNGLIHRIVDKCDKKNIKYFLEFFNNKADYDFKELVTLAFKLSKPTTSRNTSK